MALAQLTLDQVLGVTNPERPHHQNLEYFLATMEYESYLWFLDKVNTYRNTQFATPTQRNVAGLEIVREFIFRDVAHNYIDNITRNTRGNIMAVVHSNHTNFARNTFDAAYQEIHVFINNYWNQFIAYLRQMGFQ